MRINTVEALNIYLSEDLAWRKKELSILLSLAELNRSNPAMHNALIRSCVTMIYAHWEGYISNAAKAYLSFIAQRRLKYCELSDSLCAISVKSKLNSAIDSKRFDSLMQVANFFLNQQNERSNLKADNVISTKSNLGSTVLEEIASIISIDYRHYTSKKKLLDDTLLENRNKIAHGNYVKLNYDQLEKLHHEIISLMNTFKNQIENAAQTGEYKKKIAATA